MSWLTDINPYVSYIELGALVLGGTWYLGRRFGYRKGRLAAAKDAEEFAASHPDAWPAQIGRAARKGPKELEQKTSV